MLEMWYVMPMVKGFSVKELSEKLKTNEISPHLYSSKVGPEDRQHYGILVIDPQRY